MAKRDREREGQHDKQQKWQKEREREAPTTDVKQVIYEAQTVQCSNTSTKTVVDRHSQKAANSLIFNTQQFNHRSQHNQQLGEE
jgi:hypothetical protein